jgi:ubiquinone/menaquinone biosynthesis C-methylase UbiE
MEEAFEKIKEVQKAAWNKTSAGWKKWDSMMMQFLQPMNNEMIHMLNFRETDYILDVATGTGEPGLSIASMLKSGKVTGIDLSEKMLDVANEHAMQRGINNFETICCDASELPFDDETFDGITCRLSFMFFPDMKMALNEMMRVLKPGGRICASYWNAPEKNQWISILMEVMIRRLNLNPPTPGGPGAYRCAEPGMMSALFSNAGLKHIKESIAESDLLCDNKENYWNFISEVASPAAFSNADEITREQIKTEILSRLKEKSPGENICLSSSATIICGQKQ